MLFNKQLTKYTSCFTVFVHFMLHGIEWGGYSVTPVFIQNILD